MKRLDLFGIQFLNKLYITIAIYKEGYLGIIKLGIGRYSLNLFRLSLIIEYY